MSSSQLLSNNLKNLETEGHICVSPGSDGTDKDNDSMIVSTVSLEWGSRIIYWNLTPVFDCDP